jgi:hypothetical protein
MFDAGIEFKDFEATLNQGLFKSQFQENYSNYLHILLKIILLEHVLSQPLKRLNFQKGIDRNIFESRKQLLLQDEELVFDPEFDLENLD